MLSCIGQVDGIGGSVKCDVFDKVLSNQYQMDSGSIFVIATQNMPHISMFLKRNQLRSTSGVRWA